MIKGVYELVQAYHPKFRQPLVVSHTLYHSDRDEQWTRVAANFFVKDLSAIAPKMCPDQSQAFKDVNNSEAFTVRREKRKMVKGGYTPWFFSHLGGTGETRPRKAFPRAPTCVKCNSKALARRPQPMPSTHTVFFLFGNVLGPIGTAVLEGAKESPLLTTSGGDITPQIH